MSENTTNIIPPATDYLDSRGRWFTDAELRQRDERIIQAAFNVTTPGGWFIHDSTYDAIIVAAEADRD